MPVLKPRKISFKSNIEKIVKSKKKLGDNNPSIFLKEPKEQRKLIDVSKESNRFKTKTNFEAIEKAQKQNLELAKKKIERSTLVQIKDNIRDPLAKEIPNSLPRKSSLLGIVNSYKKHGITNFTLAITDFKTGKVMGYTAIRLSKSAQNFINSQFRKSNLESKSGEHHFRLFADKMVSLGEKKEQRYENHLKEIMGFQIKYKAMPGYVIDPITKDFRRKTLKEKITFKK